MATTYSKSAEFSNLSRPNASYSNKIQYEIQVKGWFTIGHLRSAILYEPKGNIFRLFNHIGRSKIKWNIIIQNSTEVDLKWYGALNHAPNSEIKKFLVSKRKQKQKYDPHHRAETEMFRSFVDGATEVIGEGVGNGFVKAIVDIVQTVKDKFTEQIGFVGSDFINNFSDFCFILIALYQRNAAILTVLAVKYSCKAFNQIIEVCQQITKSATDTRVVTQSFESCTDLYRLLLKMACSVLKLPTKLLTITREETDSLFSASKAWRDFSEYLFPFVDMILSKISAWSHSLFNTREFWIPSSESIKRVYLSYLELLENNVKDQIVSNPEAQDKYILFREDYLKMRKNNRKYDKKVETRDQVTEMARFVQECDRMLPLSRFGNAGSGVKPFALNFYGKPGVGKTTVCRDLAIECAGAVNARRTSRPFDKSQDVYTFNPAQDFFDDYSGQPIATVTDIFQMMTDTTMEPIVSFITHALEGANYILPNSDNDRKQRVLFAAKYFITDSQTPWTQCSWFNTYTRSEGHHIARRLDAEVEVINIDKHGRMMPDNSHLQFKVYVYKADHTKPATNCMILKHTFDYQQFTHWLIEAMDAHMDYQEKFGVSYSHQNVNTVKNAATSFFNSKHKTAEPAVESAAAAARDAAIRRSGSSQSAEAENGDDALFPLGVRFPAGDYSDKWCAPIGGATIEESQRLFLRDIEKGQELPEHWRNDNCSSMTFDMPSGYVCKCCKHVALNENDWFAHVAKASHRLNAVKYCKVNMDPLIQTGQCRMCCKWVAWMGCDCSDDRALILALENRAFDRFRCRKCEIETNSYTSMDCHLRSARHTTEKGTGYVHETCVICKLDFNSTKQLSDHLSGAPHKRAVDRLNLEHAQRTYCRHCDVEVTSPAMYKQHCEGRKHKKKVAETLLAETESWEDVKNFASKQYDQLKAKTVSFIDFWCEFNKDIAHRCFNQEHYKFEQEAVESVKMRDNLLFVRCFDQKCYGKRFRREFRKRMLETQSVSPKDHFKRVYWELIAVNRWKWIPFFGRLNRVATTERKLHVIERGCVCCALDQFSGCFMEDEVTRLLENSKVWTLNGLTETCSCSLSSRTWEYMVSVNDRVKVRAGRAVSWVFNNKGLIGALAVAAAAGLLIWRAYARTALKARTEDITLLNPNQEQAEFINAFKNSIFRISNFNGDRYRANIALGVGSKSFLVNNHYWDQIEDQFSIDINNKPSFLIKEYCKYTIVTNDIGLVTPERPINKFRTNISRFILSSDNSERYDDAFSLTLKESKPVGIPLKNVKLSTKPLTVDNTADGSTIKAGIGSFYEYDAVFGKGSCGSGLVLKTAKGLKIAGLHFAGNGRMGFSIALTRESIEKALTTNGDVEVIRPSRLIDAERITLQSENMEARGFHVVGAPGTAEVKGLQCRLQERTPAATKIGLTPLGESLLENNWIEENEFSGPHFKPFYTENGDEVRPVDKAVDKMLTRAGVLDERKLQQIVGHIVGTLKDQVDLQDKSLLDMQQAIAGVKTEEIELKPLNLATSIGCPYSSLPGVSGKRPMMDRDPDTLDVYIDQDFKNHVESLEEDLISGEYEEIVVRDTLKDEKLPKWKVDEGKVRIFQVIDASYNMIGRMYFGRFMGAVNTGKTDLAIGMDPRSQDWNELVRRLATVNGGVIEDDECMLAGDYKAYDSTISPQLANAVAQVINGWYDDSRQNKNVRTRLLEALFTSVHFLGSSAYKAQQGNPSGNFLTTIANGIVNMILHRYVYMSNGGKLRRYNQHVQSSFMGDDNISAVAEEAKQYISMISMRDILRDLGITFTSASKKEITRGFIRLSECSYLKRGFKWSVEEQMWLAPLEIEVVKNIGVNGLAKNFYDAEIVNAQIEDQLNELAIHSQEEHDAYQKLIVTKVVPSLKMKGINVLLTALLNTAKARVQSMLYDDAAIDRDYDFRVLLADEEQLQVEVLFARADKLKREAEAAAQQAELLEEVADEIEAQSGETAVKDMRAARAKLQSGETALKDIREPRVKVQSGETATKDVRRPRVKIQPAGGSRH